MRHSRFLTSMVVALLLPAACARVTPHVSLPEIKLGEPSFFPTLEAYATAPIVGGNTAQVLLNGEQIYPAQLEAIRGAQKTINYAQYVLEDGPVTRDVTEALAERCRAGVGVNVLLDSFGSLAAPTPYIDAMRQAGCHVAWFRPLRRLQINKAGMRNHRRIIVVDGKIGFTGGAGLSRKWMGDGHTPDHWRDTDVRLEGPVVNFLQGAFAENWLEATGVVLGGDAYFPPPPPPKGQVYAQLVRSSPGGGSAAMYTTLLLALASARRSIFITNPYFVLDDKWTEVLLDARKRGVRVVILTPGVIDHALVRQASRAEFGRLLLGGIEIFEYRASLLHAKTMVIDSVWSTVGSTNLDNRSFAANDEMNVILYSSAFAQRMEAVFHDDLTRARPVTYDGWKHRGIRERLFELIAVPIRGAL